MAGTKAQVEGIGVWRASTILATSSDVLKSLDGIDTRPIPDRSTCYVEENESQYRFFSASVAVPAPPNVVAPLVGPGRWLIETGGGGGAKACCGMFEYLAEEGPTSLVLPGFAGVPVYANLAVPLIPGPFNDDACFIPGPGPGEMVYVAAPTQVFKLELAATIAVPDLTPPPDEASLFLAFNVNGSPVPFSQIFNFFPEGEPNEIVTFGLVELSTGDIVRGRLAQGSTPGPLTVEVGAALATFTPCGGGAGDSAVLATTRIRATSGQAIVDGGLTLLDMDTIDVDTLGAADLPNDAITIVTPGIYLVGAYITLDAQVGVALNMGVAINGVTAAASSQDGAGNEQAAAVSAVVSLSAGDMVQAFVTTGAGINPTNTAPVANSPIVWATRVG